MNNREIIKIGTRGSKLALYQANRVKSILTDKFPEYNYQVIIIKTKGDKILDVPLSKIGDKGLFTKELENALFDGRINMAVHSLKDLPTLLPEGLKQQTVLVRENNREAIISTTGKTLNNLTHNDIIATSSLRRIAQLKTINKNFKIVDIRGNVNSRIKKMEEGYCSAMIMAVAGVKRLGLETYISEIIEPEKMIPACGQGAIAIETLSDDIFIEKVLKSIKHNESCITSAAERTFLKVLEGGCQIPIGSFATIIGEELFLTGYLSDINGETPIVLSEKGSINNPEAIGKRLALRILDRGGKEVLESFKNINIPIEQKSEALKGIKIISTKPIRKDDILKEKIENAGGEFISLPTIEIKNAKLNDNDINELKQIDRYDWLIFTSKNGVHHFFESLNDINGNTLLNKKTKIATIGLNTAKEIELFSYFPDFISKGKTSEDLLNQFSNNFDLNKKNILLPLGNLAGDVLENGLNNIASVYRLNIYNTVMPNNIDKKIFAILEKELYDIIIFTSPSAFHNLLKTKQDLNLSNIKAACIGHVTAEALMEKGVTPKVIAEEANNEGLFHAIISYFNKESYN